MGTHRACEYEEAYAPTLHATCSWLWTVLIGVLTFCKCYLCGVDSADACTHSPLHLNLPGDLPRFGVEWHHDLGQQVRVAATIHSICCIICGCCGHFLRLAVAVVGLCAGGRIIVFWASPLLVAAKACNTRQDTRSLLDSIAFDDACPVTLAHCCPRQFKAI